MMFSQMSKEEQTRESLDRSLRSSGPPHMATATANTPGQPGWVQARKLCGRSPRPLVHTHILFPIRLWMVKVTLHQSEMFTLLKQLLFVVFMTLFPAPPAPPLTCRWSQTDPLGSS